jgi:hypothetical protein
MGKEGMEMEKWSPVARLIGLHDPPSANQQNGRGSVAINFESHLAKPNG